MSIENRGTSLVVGEAGAAFEEHRDKMYARMEADEQERRAEVRARRVVEELGRNVQLSLEVSESSPGLE